MDMQRQLGKWGYIAVIGVGMFFGAVDVTAVARPGDQDPAAVATAVVQAPAAVETIAFEDFVRRHGLGGAFVIDVRTVESFRRGHIAGAMSVPLDQIERRAADLRSRAHGRLIVTYCSCPDEHASLAAVHALATRGVSEVRALVGGFPAWVRAGGRVEQ